MQAFIVAVQTFIVTICRPLYSLYADLSAEWSRIIARDTCFIYEYFSLLKLVLDVANYMISVTISSQQNHLKERECVPVLACIRLLTTISVKRKTGQELQHVVSIDITYMNTFESYIYPRGKILQERLRGLLLWTTWRCGIFKNRK